MGIPNEEQLSSFFDEELNALSMEKGSNLRIAWLIERLEEYVSRWSGFVAATGDPGPEAPGFTMIERAASRLKEETRHHKENPPFRQAQERFVSAIVEARRHARRENVENLESAFAELRGCAPKS